MKTKVLFIPVVILFVVSSLSLSGQGTKANVAPGNAPVASKMIIAKVYAKEGRENDFIKAARMIIDNTNKEPGCTGYMMYQDPYDKTNFIFVESYKNQAAIVAHFAAPYFKEFGKLSGDMVRKPTEIKIIDVAGESGVK
jgi:quinol monooxygenase YgiN